MGVLVPFIVRYVLKTPHLIAEILLVVYVSALVSIPLWVWLARYFEKRKLWLFAMCAGCLGFSLNLGLDEGRVWIIVIASLLVGINTTCGETLGQAIKADIIDYDEYLTGERKEGAYFAAWQFVRKLAGGLMTGITLILLDLIDYQPGVEQTEATKNWMIFLLAGMPLIGYSIGIAAFTRFRFGDAEHARIRSELDARRS